VRDTLDRARRGLRGLEHHGTPKLETSCNAMTPQHNFLQLPETHAPPHIQDVRTYLARTVTATLLLLLLLLDLLEPFLVESRGPHR